MTWPILRRGQIVASIGVRDAQQQQALIAYRSAILNGLEEVENAIVAYTNAQGRHAALADAIKENERAVDFSRSRYLGGLADLRDVLDAEHHLSQIRSELIQSEVAVAIALVTLHKALGGGWRVAPHSTITAAAHQAACLASDSQAEPTCSTSP
jgi:multidrug efflux system outer membrane protein